MRAKLFGGFGNRKWKRATAMEFSRFAIYLLVPVAASVVYNDPKVMRWLITQTTFVKYPEQKTQTQSKASKFDNVHGK